MRKCLFILIGLVALLSTSPALGQRVTKVYDLTANLINSPTPGGESKDFETLGHVYVGDGFGRQWYWDVNSTWVINTNFNSTTNLVIVPSVWNGVSAGRWISVNQSPPVTTDTSTNLLMKLDAQNGVATNLSIYGANYPRVAVLDNSGLLTSDSAITITELQYLDNATGNLQAQINGKLNSSGGSVTNLGLPSLTPGRVATINSLGNLANSTVTETELSYIDNVVSDVQSQLNGKLNASGGVATNFSISGGGLSRAVVTTGSGTFATSSATATEVGYLSGVTSAIQPQINALISGGSVAAKLDAQNGVATNLSIFGATINRVAAFDGSGVIVSGTPTVTELNTLSGVTSGIQSQFTGKLNGSGATATNLAISGSTANRAAIIDASNRITSAATTTSTELGYVSGVTSAIQPQINGKLSSSGGTATNLTFPSLTASRAAIINSGGVLVNSTVTDTELGYIDNVTSDVQSQLNSKLNASGGIATNLSVSGGTASRIVVTDGTAKLTTTVNATSTEVERLAGVTSNIQPQINAKFDATNGIGVGPSFSGLASMEDILADSFTRSILFNTNKVAVWNSINGLTNSTVSIAELEGMDGRLDALEVTTGLASAIDKGDISISISGTAYTVDPGAVTFSKIQNINGSKLLGRGVGAAGAPQEITLGTGLSMAGTTVNASTGLGIIPAADVAAMTNISPSVLTNGMAYVKTAGRTVAGVGGATYRFDSASTATPNLGTVFAHASIPGRFIFSETTHPNIDMFGAIPDFGGVNNGSDKQAFTNALSVLPVGSMLTLSIGTYRATDITNSRAISMIGVKGSRPTWLSREGSPLTNNMPAWGMGSEIEAETDGWVLTIEGRPYQAHSVASDNESLLQPIEIANIGFFGKERTLNAGGLRVANSDGNHIHNNGFYAFKKAGFWAQRAMRESLIEYNDIRYCGDADAVDSPDPNQGWAGMMIMDEAQGTTFNGTADVKTLVEDHNNFNLYQYNRVSFSLGSALIVDTKGMFDLSDFAGARMEVTFDERFSKNLWHAYSGSSGLASTDLSYAYEYNASPKKLSSPLAICRAVDRLTFDNDFFWFTGANTNHLVFENNTIITNWNSRTVAGAVHCTVSNCKFYGAITPTHPQSFILVNPGSKVSVLQNYYYIYTDSYETVENNGSVIDNYARAGRQAFDSIFVRDASSFESRVTAIQGVAISPMSTATINALSGKTQGLHLTDSTAGRAAWWNGSSLKYFAFYDELGGGGGTYNTPYSVATTNELRGLALSVLTNYAQINMAGYYTAGDGGGGMFYVDLADTTSLDDGGSVFVVNGKRVKAIFNGELSIQRWGARSGYTYNSAPHIQSAIDYAHRILGGTVILPAGDWMIADTIFMKMRVSLRGLGVNFLDGGTTAVFDTPTIPTNAGGTNTYRRGGNTVLILGPSVNKPMIDFDPTNALARITNSATIDGETVDKYQYSSTIQGIAFHGNGDNQTKYDCHPIRCIYAWGVTIKDCAFARYKGHMMFLRDNNEVMVQNCFSIGSHVWSKSIFLYSCADYRMLNNGFGAGNGPIIWLAGAGSWVATVQHNFAYNAVREYFTNSAAISADTITFDRAHVYETGMPVEVFAGVGGTIPTGVTKLKVYWVIKISSTQIKLATSYEDALAGTVRSISGGSGEWYVWHGPGSGLYLSDGPQGITVLGNRFEQHEEDGIVASDVTECVFANNQLAEEQFDSMTVAASIYNVAGIKLMNTSDNNIITGNNGHSTLANYPQAYGIWLTADAGANNRIGPNVFTGMQVSNILNQTTAIVLQTVEKNISSNDKVTLGWLGAGGPNLELIGGNTGNSLLTMERSTLNKIGFRLLGETTGALSISDITDDKYLMTLSRPTTTSVKVRFGGNLTTESRAVTIAGDDPSSSNIAAAGLTIRPPWGTGNASAAGATITFQNPVATTSGTGAHTALSTATVRAPLANRETALRLYNLDTGTLRTVMSTNLNLGDGVTRTYLYLE